MRKYNSNPSSVSLPVLCLPRWKKTLARIPNPNSDLAHSKTKKIEGFWFTHENDIMYIRADTLKHFGADEIPHLTFCAFHEPHSLIII